MVRHGQEEFRRSLRNLRASELERGTLADALRETGAQLTAGSGVEFHFQESGQPRPLTEAAGNNLLRIGQECMTNAIRHAHATKLEVVLSHAPGATRLRIADNGTGFDPKSLGTLGDGHFGWRGIHERAEQIGSRVELDSAVGHGTTVTVTTPL
jgi:signal transduction histidine kinase